MNDTQTVRRVYATKRSGYDVEAQGLLRDLRDNLKQPGLTAVRIFNRYDVSGISEEEYGQVRNLVFSEPPVDDVFDETADFGQTAAVIAIEALPGQFDQRADSAAQCIQIVTQKDRPAVRTARIIALYGQVTPDGLERIREYLINPVESREASLEKPLTLEDALEPPLPVEELAGFRRLDEAGLRALLQEMALAMSFADLQFCQQYFQMEDRDPTVTEIRVLDTYWSDHCRHTTFLTRIDDVRIDRDQPFGDVLADSYQTYESLRTDLYGDRVDVKPPCLMDLATMAMKALRRDGLLQDLDDSGEINACSIKVRIPVDGHDEDYLVMFKNETHNHPTEIEPFGGAATCLGGAIRDPLSGRTYVYQAMRVTGSGDPTVPVSQTLRGKLPQRKITTTAAAGYSSYGNQVGLATGLVDEVYHPGYIAKRMEIGAVIGAAPAKHIRREVPEPGDIVVLLGGRTGRDGCGGATGSSKAHTESSLALCGSEVQKGNPPTERKIQRLFRDPAVAGLIRRCNDFGAGGVSVAIGELADGLEIDLDRVPKKYEGLDGTEIAISESQERMAVVVAAADVASFLQAAERENLEAVPVATVVAVPRMTMKWQGQTIVSLSRSFIDSNGAPQQTRVHVTLPEAGASYFTRLPEGLERGRFAESVTGILGSLQACSRQGLAERFDSTIGAGTVLMPFGGRHQRTPEEGMAALIPVLDGKTTACTLMTYGFDPYLSSYSPYHGAYYAVVTALARIAALGGDPSGARLTLQEYFERLKTEEQWGKPLAALLGAFQAQLDFQVPAIGGKDSMSGSFGDLHVPPTLVAFAVAVTDASRVRSATIPAAGQTLYLLSPRRDAQGLPDAESLRQTFTLLQDPPLSEHVTAAGVVQGSGAAIAAIRMCFGEMLGLTLAGELSESDLFAPDHGALIVVLPDPVSHPAVRAAAERLLQAGGRVLGTTTAEAFVRYRQEQLPLETAFAAYEKTLEPIFPTRTRSDRPATDLPPKKATSVKHSSGTGLAKPRVVIPVFPGTNCEYDTARAFAKAGADPDVLVIRNLTSEAIAESLHELERRIRQAQMIMIPGGFSGGDEPEGSGKFIASAFRNPRVTDAVRDLLQNRDGLMLGICNGFQALIKLGLLPYGDIVDLAADSPTLTFNRIGRHVSRLVTTRIVSNRSPWLAAVEPGDLHVIPVSHGEGRFAATDSQIADLASSGQIATQYVDLAGQPTIDTAFNPNGSAAGIEGLISPDGRILGKMGHSERFGASLYRNVPGDKDQHLFVSGVRYFK